MKKILVLGAGLVAKPLVKYLINEDDFEVTVATRTVRKAEQLVENSSNGKAVQLDVNNTKELRRLIKKSDITISLLPYTFHAKVAKICIEFGRHMVTTSYISDEMQALDEDAKKAEILILNEIGVDPGIDHMSAMRIIDRVENQGGKVASFKSYCGGLPAPEANDNPFGYKFSWSPKGVLKAGKNEAKYLKDGQIIEIDGEELFQHYWPLEFEDAPAKFETYPNRNSLPYIDTYCLEDVDTMFRGTIRNRGWCDALNCIVKLGLLDDNKQEDLSKMTYNQLLRTQVNAGKNESTRDAVDTYLGESSNKAALDKLEWLGLFEEKQLPNENTLIDVMTALFLEKMSYQENERDMIVLFHDFLVEFPDKKQRITSTLIEYGLPNGDSAMARTVSLPAAIATRLILRNEIQEKGVHAPVIPEIYNPVLNELEKMGIVCKEKEQDF
ncbi:MAG: saccharopine dehydrogenase NADP-binding domain-containing protein [Candidatus Marinimicrobia bacterium]|nr:saccharopine dehydrogenase NADP-binding domain-containing protein [Candidatus Neomarinimicrobiota bacterium]